MILVPGSTGDEGRTGAADDVGDVVEGPGLVAVVVVVDGLAVAAPEGIAEPRVVVVGHIGEADLGQLGVVLHETVASLGEVEGAEDEPLGPLVADGPFGDPVVDVDVVPVEDVVHAPDLDGAVRVHDPPVAEELPEDVDFVAARVVHLPDGAGAVEDEAVAEAQAIDDGVGHLVDDVLARRLRRVSRVPGGRNVAEEGEVGPADHGGEEGALLGHAERYELVLVGPQDPAEVASGPVWHRDERWLGKSAQ